MVNLLIAKGAKIDSTTRDGLTPLHCAARSGHEQVIDILSENNANILSKTKVCPNVLRQPKYSKNLFSLCFF